MSDAEYVDYITDKAERFRLTDEKVFEHAKEHGNILNALSERNMTVKEIHTLYALPNGKHTKTVKTVYRYLDILEQLDLIKVAGHRKYKGARSLEKLYCRTARVFFNDDASKKAEWYESDDGNKFMEALTAILLKTRERGGDKAQLKALLVEYFKKQKEQTHLLIERITSEDKYADLLDQLSLYHIKSVLDIVPTIEATFENKELVEKMRKLLR